MVKIDIKSASPQWAEAAMEIFKEALNEGDIKLCQSIISDVLDAGHYRTTRLMKEMLRDSYPKLKI